MKSDARTESTATPGGLLSVPNSQTTNVATTALSVGTTIRIRTVFLAGGAFVAAIVSGCNPAFAVEGGTFGGPIGGTDIRQAFLPPTTGLYGGLVGVGITAPSLQGVDGNASKAAAPSYIGSFIGGGGLLYVYPINPLGFTIASSFQLAWQTTAQELNTRAGLRSGIVNGLTDSYADIFLASHYIGLMGADPGLHPIPRLRYGLTGAFGVGVEIPLGSYSPTKFPTTGKNTFITIPSIAFTYLTGPNLSLADGTELSVRMFYEVNSRNPATLYQGGNIFDIDWSVTQRQNSFQYGVAGLFAQQLNGDVSKTSAQVAPDGNRFEKLGLGPVIAYDSEALHSTIKFKALFPIHNENAYLTTQYVLSASFKLY